MSSRRRALGSLIAIALCTLGAGATSAQAPRVQLRAAHIDTTGIAGGQVVTVVFTVMNDEADTARVAPTVVVPSGWVTVTGTSNFRVGPHVRDTWLVSVRAPANAGAGSYVVRGILTASGVAVSDSAVVKVREHHAVEVLPLDVPSWVAAGGRYEAHFMVRNRGNVPTTIALSGTTSRGVQCDVDAAAVMLAPGATATVGVHVSVGNNMPRTSDDVIELTAVDEHESTARATASERTTIVAQAADESDLSTVPAQLSLRAAGAAAGVAPATLIGSGRINDSNTSVDFAMIGPTGLQSTNGFGEREAYRLAVHNDLLAVHLGDDVYGFSPLTSSGSMGFGASVQETRGILTGGVYAERIRWTPGMPAEAGMFLGASLPAAIQATTSLVERQGVDGAAIHVASVGAKTLLPTGTTVELEVASSDSAGVSGSAQRAQISGEARGLTYELGSLHSTSEFAGPARGNQHADALLTANPWRALSFSATASVHTSTWEEWDGGVLGAPFALDPMGERLAMANVAASYGGLATLEYGWLSRHDDGMIEQLDGVQHGARIRSTLPLGPANLSASLSRGTVTDAGTGVQHEYTSLELSARTELTSGSWISLFSTLTAGRTLTGTANGIVGGGAAQIRVTHALEVGLSASLQTQPQLLINVQSPWFGVVDAHADYQLPTGATLGLHARILRTPTFASSDQQGSAIYLELRVPVHIPTGRSHELGRAEGRIVDSETGQPLVGALVRVGNQAAVTDREGRVSFSALDSAVYHVSLDATGPAAGALLVGDASLDMRAQSDRPKTFSLGVAHGSRIRVAVRRLEAVGSTLETGRDSLVDAGAIPDVVVALVSGRDTIYQASDAHGRLDFGGVAPGVWTVAVMPADLPAHHAFEADRVQVTLTPGESREVEFRLVPQKRTVTFVGDGAELKAKPAPSNKE